MQTLNAYARRKVVCHRTGGRCTAIDEFQGEGGGMGEGMQLKANQDGGVQEAVRGPGVDQRLDGNRRPTQNEKVDKKGKMARGRKRERGGKGKSAAQPGSYWLGWEFFDAAAAAAAVAAAAAAAA